jgi:hypothetical protein
MGGLGVMTLIVSAAVIAELQLEGIIAAGITSLCALVGVIWQSRKTRRINTEEHNFNATKLDQIETKLDKVDYRVERVQGKLEDHLDEHNKQSP